MLKIKNATLSQSDGILKNKSFLVTGKLNGISRAEVKSLIEENSGTTVSSVSKKLDYLIVRTELGNLTINRKDIVKVEMITPNIPNLIFLVCVAHHVRS